MRHDWTDSNVGIAATIGLCDAIEVAGCREAGDTCVERCDSEPPDFYSIYLHYIPCEAEQRLGVTCIADRSTKSAALDYANSLAALYSLPVHDFT